MTIGYDELVANLAKENSNFGLLSMQATGTAEILANAFPSRLKALFSAEHGFFGMAAAGEKTPDAVHKRWNIPIFSLYGEKRKPDASMFEGLGRIVIDLADIGVRCYTYLATMKNMLEACAENSVPATVLDRPVPLGGHVDGPMPDPSLMGFVAPLDLPLCHGMTPGECAAWIAADRKLPLDLDIVTVREWNHGVSVPWSGFVPPSPAIRSWDSAAMYPMTVFTEAYPALDCDRLGTMAFRVAGAPWLDADRLARQISPGFETCGYSVRPYRFAPSGGPYSGTPIDGLLVSFSGDGPKYPVTAGTLMLAALLRNYPEEMAKDARPRWLDSLFAFPDAAKFIAEGSLSDLFTGWIDAQDAFLETKVDFYSR